MQQHHKYRRINSFENRSKNRRRKDIIADYREGSSIIFPSFFPCPSGNSLVDIKRYPASVLQTNLGVPCVPQLTFAMHDLRTEHEAKAVRADVNKEFNWLISTTPLGDIPTPALPTHNKTSLIFFTYARTKLQKRSCGWGCKLG